MMKESLKRLFTPKAGKFIAGNKVGIQANDISSYAVETVRKLQDYGYQAYIVGGAVRDILLGFHPKDFDIATNARPEEVRQVFRRQSRIIGRRFRIVHIYYRSYKNRFHDFLEVSTFRANGSDNDTLTQNNVYGEADDDAYRRDFTINGIFYDPCADKVIDYVGGIADIRAKRLRTIGAAKERLPEDPVRILRAIRLSTKLGLTMKRDMEKLLSRHAPDLADIPHARLFDELTKVLRSGASARILKEWQQYGICPFIIPILNEKNPFFFSLLAETDRRLSENRKTSLSFIIAGLFWPDVAERWHALLTGHVAPVRAMEKVIGDTPFSSNRIIPQRLTGRVKEVFFLQAQMHETPSKRRTLRLMQHPYFDRALAFASMRQDDGAAQIASWWAQFTHGDRQEQERMLAQLPAGRKRRKRKKSGKNASAAK